MSNVAILVVSCAKHFHYLKYCLRSIDKFADGFRKTVLMVPRTELDELYTKTDVRTQRKPLDVVPFDEWPGKGMLHHMAIIMDAPRYCPLSDAILHFDSDMVFTEPVTPDDYMEGDKPVMVHATFKWLVQQQANLDMWRVAVEQAIGGKCEREMMRRPGIVHLPCTYEKAREMMEQHTKMPFAEYIASGQDAFPQQFCEFCTLGWVAWLHFHDRYKWVEQGVDPFPPLKIRQMWSHRQLTDEDNEWMKKLGLE